MVRWLAFASCASLVAAASLGACTLGESNGASAFSGEDGAGGGEAGGPCDATACPTSDAAADGGVGLQGDSGLDARGDADGSDGHVESDAPTSVLFVHAAPGLPDVRFCWGFGAHSADTVQAFPSATLAPESNYPAVPVGGAGLLVKAAALTKDFWLWAIDARASAEIERANGTSTCAQLLSSTGKRALSAGQYWLLPNQVKGIPRHQTTVVALTGCPAGDGDASAPLCGAGWDGGAAGNLHTLSVSIGASATPGPGQLAVQALQLSPAVASAVGSQTASLSFGGTDAGAIAQLGVFGGVTPTAGAALVDLGASPSFTAAGFGLTVPRAKGSPAQLWMSLEQALSLYDPTMNPAVYFAQPTSYAVAVLGDPYAPLAYGKGATATPDGTQLHVIVVALPGQ